MTELLLTVFAIGLIGYVVWLAFDSDDDNGGGGLMAPVLVPVRVRSPTPANYSLWRLCLDSALQPDPGAVPSRAVTKGTTPRLIWTKPAERTA
jgi:hypothetical protein